MKLEVGWYRRQKICPTCGRSVSVINWGGGLYQFYYHKSRGEWCPVSGETVRDRFTAG